MAENEEDRGHLHDESMNNNKTNKQTKTTGLDLRVVFGATSQIHHACSQFLADVWHSASARMCAPSLSIYTTFNVQLSCHLLWEAFLGITSQIIMALFALLFSPFGPSITSLISFCLMV